MKRRVWGMALALTGGAALLCLAWVAQAQVSQSDLPPPGAPAGTGRVVRPVPEVRPAPAKLEGVPRATPGSDLGNLETQPQPEHREKTAAPTPRRGVAAFWMMLPENT